MQAGKWQELTEANCNQWTLDKVEVKKLAYLSKSNRICLPFTQYAHWKNLYQGVSISIGTFNKISGDTSKWKHLLDSFDCDLIFECFDRQIFWFFALKQYLFDLKFKKKIEKLFSLWYLKEWIGWTYKWKHKTSLYVKNDLVISATSSFLFFLEIVSFS